jgi:hypothetical protein
MRGNLVGSCLFPMSEMSFLYNPGFQLSVGFLASVLANYLFFGKMEKRRAQRESERAYNRLTNRLVHTTVSDINHPLELLPLEISDRVEDLKYALRDVDPKMDRLECVKQAISQAAETRKKQSQDHSGTPICAPSALH